jgi:beta-lactamase superfamily II metal-dependent hydrolase
MKIGGRFLAGSPELTNVKPELTNVKLTSFDVGQATWNLLDFGRGRLAIIDCGAARAEDGSRVAEQIGVRLRREPDTRIEFLAISHFDHDHVSGVSALLDDRVIADRIDAVICNSIDLRLLASAIKRVGLATAGSGAPRSPHISRAATSILRVLKFIREREATSPDFHRDIASPAPGDPSIYPVVLATSDVRTGARISFLAPSQKLKNKSQANLRAIRDTAESTLDDLLGVFKRPTWNTAGIVMLLEEGTRRVLVPGDATAVTWEEVLNRVGNNDVSCDVIVAWHHGGSLGKLGGIDYDDRVWSRVLRPGRPTVVMSHDGDRRYYRHPHDRTVETLKLGNADVFCTRLRFSNDTERVIDIERAFPTARFGHALDFGGGSPPVYRRTESLTCCGDITVDVSRNGVSTSCSSSTAQHRRSNPACCQYR